MSWDSKDDQPLTQIEIEEECERDDLYYFETVVFKVENTLFRVPKSGLDVEGTVFETMFTLPQSEEGANGSPEGSSDEHPIILNDISKAHFRGFLRSIYRFTATPLTYEEMAGAMQLAFMWEFSELRKRLIDELSPHIAGRPIHETILLARVCKVKQWLTDAYRSLVLETSGSDLLELGDKGIDAMTIAKLFHVREQLGRRQEVANVGRHYCSYCGNYHCGHQAGSSATDAQVLEKISEVFVSEFVGME